MRRDQTAHETLIPFLVGLIGAQSYLEFGTHANETINRVQCPRRYGVDIHAVPLEDAQMFTMTTQEFIAQHAAEFAPYDAVLIDADHSAEAVLNDFFGIAPYVSEDGLIFLHDVNPETIADVVPGLCGDAWRAAEKLDAMGCSGVVLPYHPGLMIIRKHLRWGPKNA